MASKKTTHSRKIGSPPDNRPPNEPGQDRSSNLRLPSNVTPEQAMTGIFKIKPEDVKRIVGSKPERKGGATKGDGNREQSRPA